MEQRIIDFSRNYIIGLCKDKEFFWLAHIKSVVKYAGMLADEYECDKEVVVVSAWLHDIRKINGQMELHHVYGADDAEKLLLKWDYDKEKIAKVKHCILTHSSDKNYPPDTIEAKILASADALSHFDNLPLMINKAYHITTPDKVNEWILAKYERSLSKMMPNAMKLVEARYAAIKLLLTEDNVDHS
jgi:putative nucleotidyltransferase with HDIG domain